MEAYTDQTAAAAGRKRGAKSNRYSVPESTVATLISVADAMVRIDAKIEALQAQIRDHRAEQKEQRARVKALDISQKNFNSIYAIRKLHDDDPDAADKELTGLITCMVSMLEDGQLDMFVDVGVADEPVAPTKKAAPSSPPPPPAPKPVVEETAPWKADDEAEGAKHDDTDARPLDEIPDGAGDAFHAGRIAGLDGDDASCPYSDGSREARLWWQGHAKGKAQRLQQTVAAEPGEEQDEAFLDDLGEPAVPAVH